MRQRRVASALEGEQPDLGPVAVGDDEFVVSSRWGRAPRRRPRCGGPGSRSQVVRPRRSRALPPRATTIRISVPEGGDHDRLDRVEPVLGLIEHDRTGRLEDLVGDLERVSTRIELASWAPTSVWRSWRAGRQCMNLHVRVARGLEDRRRDLIRKQEADPVLPLLDRLSHRQPHVGVEVVGPPDRLGRRPRSP